ncbi:MAG: hypothetical protein ABIZ56_06410 [Chthoniobacteraceae bacterium]
MNVKIATAAELKTVTFDKRVFDNESVAHLMRRLPLAMGYKTTVPVIATLGSSAVIPVGIEVMKKELLEVPAGKFECFKVKLKHRADILVHHRRTSLPREI